MISILMLRDFKEDQRFSMEIYAESLINALKNSPCEINVGEYIPVVPRFLSNKNGMRFARYFLYPLQILGKKALLYHIIDHGYAHLTHFLNAKRTVVTVHDLIPIVWWKGEIPGVKPHRIPLLALISFSSLRKAQHLIADSESTKKDLIRFLNLDPSKISVVNPGLDSSFRRYDEKEKHSARIKWFGENSNKKIILITGSQFYKNHEIVLKTISQFNSNDRVNINIVKTTRPSSQWESLVRKYRLEDSVINLGNVSRADMPSLFNAVDLLFFPSLYEGFGWPPLEAMACGTPVVSSNAGSLPEVIGEAAAMYEPYDFTGFANEIAKIFSIADYRQKRIEEGLNQAGKFTWKKTALEVINVYRDIISHDSYSKKNK